LAYVGNPKPGQGGGLNVKRYPRIVLLGFLVWLIPFVVAIAIFPLRESSRALFESIMPVVVALCVVLLCIPHFKRVDTGLLKEGFLLGVIWLLICLVLDLLMFMQGPMKMTLADYMMDIGLTYLIIPTITIGVGYIAEPRR